MTTLDARIVTKIILPVADLDAALAFYTALGFETERFDDGYAWVRHGGDEILHLRRVAGLDTVANSSSGYFHVQDAAAWHEDLVSRAEGVGPLEDQPWGMREFTLTDPSGNVIRVGQNL